MQSEILREGFYGRENPARILKLIFFGLFFLGLAPFFSLLGQNLSDKEYEYKVLTPVEITPPPIIPHPVQRGVIRTLTWRCKMDDLICFLPLAEIEFVALHEYTVDGKIIVLESTAVMKSKALVRFYYVEKIKPTSKDSFGDVLVQNLLERSAEAEERIKSQSPQIGTLHPALASETDQQYVVKNYPVTTHTQIIEYRLKKKKNIQDIYKSLEIALVQFKAFPFVQQQQKEILEGIEFNKQGRLLRGEPAYPYTTDELKEEIKIEE